MRREELAELHFITAISNVPSILQRGILSHRRAAAVPHTSVARQDIQARRAVKMVPGGLSLHEYANLYFNARNTMLYYLYSKHATLTVLRVRTHVLTLPGVVVADQNAASNYVRFAPAADGLARIDRGMLFARSWKHPDDQILEWRHKSVMCAEVLVPNRVDPSFVVGAYVSSEQCRRDLQALVPGLPITVNADLFFRT